MWEIHGAGVAGSYLYNRLDSEGFEVRIKDPKVENYYIPCGFASNSSRLKPYLSKAGIDFESIVLDQGRGVTIEGHKFPPFKVDESDICTIDKMGMENQFLKWKLPERNGRMDASGYHIDATGITRAFLPKPMNDTRMFAIEKICKTSEHDDFYFYFFPRGTGYFWSFPIKDGFHIGAGGINLGEVKRYLEPHAAEKTVSRNIRMSPILENIVSGNVIGVGESIGYISPVLGEGIVPALESAEILFQIIRRESDFKEISLSYEREVTKKLQTYRRISELVKNVQNSKVFTLGNILTMRSALKEVKNFGINLSIRKIMGHFL